MTNPPRMTLRLASALLAIVGNVPLIVALALFSSETKFQGVADVAVVVAAIGLGPLALVLTSLGVAFESRRARPLHLLALLGSFFLNLFVGAMVGANGGDGFGWFLLAYPLLMASFVCTAVLVLQRWRDSALTGHHSNTETS